jgi:acyl-CoA synthetase (AMP-forming)/AMP-acid ligase II
MFLRTGDIGEIDENGLVTLRGRIKDLILSGGLNVYPSDIEAVLLEHPLVADAAVVGMAHERWGETPVAHVIAKAGVEVDPAALREWTNARVAKHQRLTDVVLRTEDFPRNALGKVLKAQLRTGR